MTTKCTTFSRCQQDLSAAIDILSKDINLFFQNPDFKREIVHVSEFVFNENYQSGSKRVSVIVFYKEISAGEQWTKD